MKKITFVIVLFLSIAFTGWSQTYTMTNGTINAGCTGTFYDPGGTGNYTNGLNITQTFCAPAGQYLVFNFSSFSLGNNDYLYVYDGSSTAAPLIGHFAQTTNPVTLSTSTPGGCLTFVFTSNASSVSSGWVAALSCSSTLVNPPAGDACLSANAFCTGTNYNFPNNTGIPSAGNGSSGGIYGCLGSTPNPVWYYMQIGTGGNLTLNISQTSNGGSAIDVDFALWGPFTSLPQGCGLLSSSNIVDCSYSSSATETATITGAVAGQYYILLLTNFNGAAGNISFGASSGSTATTDCGILCTVTASNSGPVCTNGTFNLNATTPVNNPTFSWAGPSSFSSSSQNPAGVTPPASGAQIYTVTVTSGTATCNATTTVTVNQVPSVNAGTASALTCSQPNTLLDASSTPSGTIVWNGPGATNAADPFNASQAGTYTATATSNGCSSTGTITVTSNTTTPVASFTTPDGTVLDCNTQSVNLNGSATPAGATVAWTSASGSLAGNPVTVSAPGTYTVTATNPANGCTATNTVTITSNGATPNISVATSPNTTVLSCLDTLITLTGGSTTPNTSDSWVGPNGGIVGNPITVNTPGVYTYQVTDDNNGCQSSQSVNITINTTAPAINIVAPNNVISCSQPSVSLAGTSTTPGTTFAWTLNGAPVAGNPINVTDSGTYVLTVTNTANGCTSTMSQQITKDITPPNSAINAPSTTINCLVSSVSLLGTSTTSGATFGWNGPGGATSSNPNTVNTAGIYTLTVTNPTNGCTSTQSVTVVEDITPPGVSYTAPQGTDLDCNTPQVSLNGSSPLGTATLVWTGSAGVIPGNPATVGSADTYTITATNPANGCSSFSTAVVTSTGALPDISYTASAPNITCAIASVDLEGESITPNVSIQWSGASGPLAGNPVSVTSAGSYTLTITDLSTGCSSTSSVLVGQDLINPTATIIPSLTTLTCASTSASLTASSSAPNSTFSWNGPSGNIAGNPAVISSAGTYTVTVTNPANGCSGTQTVTIGSNTTPPVASISNASSVLTCTNTSIQLVGSANPSSSNLAWVAGATGANPVVNATTPTTYSLVATDPNNGCSASASVVITQNTATPGANAGPDQTLNCNGNPITLNGSSPTPNATFSWSGPQLFSSTQVSPTTTVAGTYTLSVTDPVNGCVGTDIVSVLTNTSVPQVTAGLDQQIKCNRPVVALNGNSTTANVTYSWAGPGITTPVTTQVCSTSVVGSYTLTVTNTITGCSASDIVLVTSTPGPNASFTENTVVGVVPLTVDFTNTSTYSNNYSWNFGNGSASSAASPSVTYTEEGTYQVMLISSISGNCKDTAFVTIEVLPVTQVIIPNIFSPNGDNVNDLFKAKTIGVTELTIDVFDRWGKHVITMNGLTDSWNGAGKSEGTYFYVAKGKGVDLSDIDESGFFMMVK